MEPSKQSAPDENGKDGIFEMFSSLLSLHAQDDNESVPRNEYFEWIQQLTPPSPLMMPRSADASHELIEPPSLDSEIPLPNAASLETDCVAKSASFENTSSQSSVSITSSQTSIFIASMGPSLRSPIMLEHAPIDPPTIAEFKVPGKINAGAFTEIVHASSRRAEAASKSYASKSCDAIVCTIDAADSKGSVATYNKRRPERSMPDLPLDRATTNIIVEALTTDGASSHANKKFLTNHQASDVWDDLESILANHRNNLVAKRSEKISERSEAILSEHSNHIVSDTLAISITNPTANDEIISHEPSYSIPQCFPLMLDAAMSETRDGVEHMEVACVDDVSFAAAIFPPPISPPTNNTRGNYFDISPSYHVAKVISTLDRSSSSNQSSTVPSNSTITANLSPDSLHESASHFPLQTPTLILSENFSVLERHPDMQHLNRDDDDLVIDAIVQQASSSIRAASKAPSHIMKSFKNIGPRMSAQNMLGNLEVFDVFISNQEPLPLAEADGNCCDNRIDKVVKGVSKQFQAESKPLDRQPDASSSQEGNLLPRQIELVHGQSLSDKPIQSVTQKIPVISGIHDQDISSPSSSKEYYIEEMNSSIHDRSKHAQENSALQDEFHAAHNQRPLSVKPSFPDPLTEASLRYASLLIRKSAELIMSTKEGSSKPPGAPQISKEHQSFSVEEWEIQKSHARHIPPNGWPISTQMEGRLLSPDEVRQIRQNLIIPHENVDKLEHAHQRSSKQNKFQAETSEETDFFDDFPRLDQFGRIRKPRHVPPALRDPLVKAQLKKIRVHKPNFIAFVSFVHVMMMLLITFTNFWDNKAIFSLNPFNPLLGPTKETLLKLGAIYKPCMYAGADFYRPNDTFICPAGINPGATAYFGITLSKFQGVTVTPSSHPTQSSSGTATIFTTFTQSTTTDSAHATPNPNTSPPPIIVPPGTLSVINVKPELCSLQDLCQMGGFPNSSPNQWFRFITGIMLHGGLIQLVISLLFQHRIGSQLEKAYGSARIAFIYLASGIGGLIFGYIFGPSSVSVGGSSGVCGLLGALMADCMTNYQLLHRPRAEVFKITLSLLFLIFIGYLPYIDNFAQLGGAFIGFLSGVAFLPSIFFSKADAMMKMRLKIVCMSLVLLFLLASCVTAAGGGLTSCYFCDNFNCIASLGWCISF